MRVIDQVPVPLLLKRVPFMECRLVTCPTNLLPLNNVKVWPDLNPATGLAKKLLRSYSEPIKRPLPASIKIRFRTNENGGSSPDGGYVADNSHSPARLKLDNGALGSSCSSEGAAGWVAAQPESAARLRTTRTMRLRDLSNWVNLTKPPLGCVFSELIIGEVLKTKQIKKHDPSHNQGRA